jgi:hypothetical protein
MRIPQLSRVGPAQTRNLAKMTLVASLYFAISSPGKLELHCKKHTTRDMSVTVSRRSFLKVGLAGAITLASAGGLYRALNTRSPLGKFTLDGDAKAALAAIIAVMLKGTKSISTQSTETAILRVQGAIAGLPLVTQKEIQELFALLTLGPTRRFLAGIPDNWSEAKTEDVAAFLQNWRMHRISMLQIAYHALHDLFIGPWYADESTWASIGYPGPIKELG